MLKNIIFLLIISITISCSSYRFSQPEYGVNNGDNKEIKLKKVYNLRDLGGIENQDNKKLKTGKIYRSSNLEKLKSSSFKDLEKLGIKQVIDLRTLQEIEDKPDHLPSDVEYTNLRAFEDKGDQLTEARKLVLKGKVNAEDAEKRMLDFYVEYVTEKPEVIKQIIHEILDAEQPVLFHCTAGKDRTGIVSALLMKILNFDDETIFQTYLQSNNQREKIIKKRLKLANNLHFLYPKMDIGVLEKLSWIERSYLQKSFDTIDEKYGSMDNYIREVLGISDEARRSYQAKYME
ncbi:tyrosine-protein phosphatase [Chishuiella changwenlii]|uniref:tyrosine-protein phosphatase n=1 Tax=Chishuiella changwenlii TaxID=1434701 RepID=UPI002FD94537